ncbi:bifunctional helix-turn-helix transcriptional regulator/GNAT family N-acetyltransferase [Trinickia acidisoli]|uniref:bifunctional helix-turn-helix transcriptional regulator/GNAT family N-acetyltransferase n=1 Tax=Trinickia acidisoli TaxID=2767482 RepID=UPI001A8FF141|nr:bifunctional helix-turn-helix transcriptional regulator/GNAT family N-acetyltransferase [Trinickia acidisoli]
MTEPTLLRRAEAVRRFNRFYTQHIGVLHEFLQKSPFSLTEVRVLRELALGTVSTATELARALGLDSGYLSRLLTSFERRQLITRRQSETDARQSLLEMTHAGRAAYAPLEVAAIDEVCGVLNALSAAGQEQLIAAMRIIERLLDRSPSRAPVSLRAPQAGEYGWLVHRQALLFGAQYGADMGFEAFATQEMAEFSRQPDRQRATCWIAEQQESIVGAALVAALSERAARMRLLYVEPESRGLGVGTLLVAQSIGFAQHAGYETLTLTTCGVLNDGRRVFERAGFNCVATEPERRFGRNLIAQTWERKL